MGLRAAFGLGKARIQLRQQRITVLGATGSWLATDYRSRLAKDTHIDFVGVGFDTWTEANGLGGWLVRQILAEV